MIRNRYDEEACNFHLRRWKISAIQRTMERSPMAFCIRSIDADSGMLEQNPNIIQMFDGGRSEVQNCSAQPVSLIDVYVTKRTMLQDLADTGARNRRGLVCGIRGIHQALEEMEIACVECVMEQAHAGFLGRSATRMRFSTSLGWSKFWF